MSQSLVQTKNPSVCLVHDWLITMRGGEKVLELLAILYPDAPIYTLFLRREKLSPLLQSRKIHSSFLQHIPGISKIYQWLLPLFPIAIRFFNLHDYHLVISSSHCVAKAVRVREGAVHICYCHTPMRYLWGFSEDYLGTLPLIMRSIIELYFKYLRKWDIKTSKKVTAFIANSKNTAAKILNLYQKNAVVIYPPVEIPGPEINKIEVRQDSYFLIVSALVPYKRVDLVIQAFNELKRPLKIIGDGPLKNRLENMVRFNGIEFEGWVNEKKLWARYAHCQALIFPGEEDLGMVPIEAQIFGKAVIAYGKGGAVETVLAYNEVGKQRAVNQSTGLFFYDQEPRALIEQINNFNRLHFNRSFIQEHARQFGSNRFTKDITDFIDHIADEKRNHSLF